MIIQALGISGNELTVENIQRIVDDGLSESDILELKAARIDNVQFARRTAALANNGGGVIIFGIPDEQEGDRTLQPLSFNKDLVDLQQSITAESNRVLTT